MNTNDLKLNLAFTSGVTAVALLGGCTSLEVNRIYEDTLPAARQGVSYYLPLKQFRIDTVFEVRGCAVTSQGPKLTYRTVAKVSEAQVPDVAERYVISYERLAAMTKTANLTVTMSELGLLVSLNAKTTDQTGPILASIAGTAFSIARGVALRDMVRRGPMSARDPAGPCDEVAARVQALETAEAELVKAQARDEQRAAAVGARTKASAALKLAEAKLKDARDAKDQEAISLAEKDVKVKAAAYAAADKDAADLGAFEAADKAEEVAQAKARLSVTRALYWTPGAADAGKPLAIQAARDSLEVIKLPVALADQLVAQASLTSLRGGEPAKEPDRGQTFTAEDGVVYRQPVHVLLRVCGATCQSGSANGALGGDGIAYAGVHAIPQLGVKATLPFSNGPFQDNLLSVTFGESGQPKVVAFESKASAERAAASAKEIADGYLGFVKGRESDRLDFLKGRRADEEGRLALDSKRRDAQLDVLADRLDMLKKLEALEAARAGTASSNQLAEDALAARKRQLDLLVQIKEQEKRLKELGGSPD